MMNENLQRYHFPYYGMPTEDQSFLSWCEAEFSSPYAAPEKCMFLHESTVNSTPIDLWSPEIYMPDYSQFRSRNIVSVQQKWQSLLQNIKKGSICDFPCSQTEQKFNAPKSDSVTFINSIHKDEYFNFSCGAVEHIAPKHVDSNDILDIGTAVPTTSSTVSSKVRNRAEPSICKSNILVCKNLPKESFSATKQNIIPVEVLPESKMKSLEVSKTYAVDNTFKDIKQTNFPQISIFHNFVDCKSYGEYFEHRVSNNNDNFNQERRPQFVLSDGEMEFHTLHSDDLDTGSSVENEIIMLPYLYKALNKWEVDNTPTHIISLETIPDSVASLESNFTLHYSENQNGNCFEPNEIIDLSFKDSLPLEATTKNGFHSTTNEFSNLTNDQRYDFKSASNESSDFGKTAALSSTEEESCRNCLQATNYKDGQPTRCSLQEIGGSRDNLDYEWFCQQSSPVFLNKELHTEENSVIDLCRDNTYIEIDSGHESNCDERGNNSQNHNSLEKRKTVEIKVTHYHQNNENSDPLKLRQDKNANEEIQYNSCNDDVFYNRNTLTFKNDINNSKNKFYNCNLCYGRLISIWNLKPYKKFCRFERRYKCNRCNKIFSYPNLFKVHQRNHSNENIKNSRSNKIPKSTNADAKAPNSKMCDRKKQRAQIRRNANYICGNGNLKLSNNSFQTFNSIESKTKNRVCLTESNNLSYNRKLKKHYTIYAGEAFRKRDICDKEFAHNLNSAFRKQQTPVGESCSSLQPSICGPSHGDFACKSNLEMQKNNVVENCCRNCVGSNKDSSKINLPHPKERCGVQNFNCKICVKTFSTASGLDKKAHLSEKKYECKICGKKFLHVFRFEIHKRVHVENGKYKDDSYVRKSSHFPNLCNIKRGRNREDQCYVTDEGLSSIPKLKLYPNASIEGNQGKDNTIYQARQHVLPIQVEKPIQTAGLISYGDKENNVKFWQSSNKKIQTLEKPKEFEINKESSLSFIVKETDSVNTRETFDKRDIYKSFSQASKLDMPKESNTKDNSNRCNSNGNHFSQSFSLRKKLHSVEKRCVCTICDKKFAHPSSLIIHTAIHKEVNPYTCYICNKTFSRLSYLEIHLKIHTGEKLYECNICEKKFLQSSHLQVHKRTHTGEKPYKCNICDKKFTQLCNLQSHSRMHTGEKPYFCEICCKAFAYRANLKVHRRIHTGEKPYTCNVCNKTFTFSNNLQTHVRVHTGEKPYECNTCGKTFSQLSGLYTHRKVHTGEKPHRCDICNKNFSQSSALKLHKNIHTGEKPYQCNVCYKTFSFPANLNTHKKIHTGEKPYKCCICAKRFSQSSNLDTHVRVHTGEKPYQCNICSKNFSQFSNLQVHVKRHMKLRSPEDIVRHEVFDYPDCLQIRKKIHSKEKIYPLHYICYVCNKKFPCSYKLQLHNKIHIGGALYTCVICEKQFLKASTLHVHKRVHTRKEASVNGKLTESALKKTQEDSLTE